MGRADRLPHTQHAGGSAQESPRSDDRRDPGPEQARRRRVQPGGRSDPDGAQHASSGRDRQLATVPVADSEEQAAVRHQGAARDGNSAISSCCSSSSARPRERSRSTSSPAQRSPSSLRSCEARGAALLLAEEETGDLVQYVYDAEAPGRALARRRQGRRRVSGRCHARRANPAGRRAQRSALARAGRRALQLSGAGRPGIAARG